MLMFHGCRRINNYRKRRAVFHHNDVNTVNYQLYLLDTHNKMVCNYIPTFRMLNEQ